MSILKGVINARDDFTVTLEADKDNKEEAYLFVGWVPTGGSEPIGDWKAVIQSTSGSLSGKAPSAEKYRKLIVFADLPKGGNGVLKVEEGGDCTSEVINADTSWTFILL